MVMFSHHERGLSSRWFSSGWNAEQIFLTRARNFSGLFFPMDCSTSGRVLTRTNNRVPSQEPEADFICVRRHLRRKQEDRPLLGSHTPTKSFIEGTAVALARAASKNFYFESWEIHKCEPGYFNS
jgi:hypothetical protein